MWHKDEKKNKENNNENKIVHITRIANLLKITN